MIKAAYRKATLADAELMAKFQVDMAWETEQLKLDAATVTEGINYLLQHPDRGYYLLAEVEEKVVGSVMLLYEWSDWRNGDVLWIHSLYLLPEWRGLGLYGTLYRKLQKEVRASKQLRGLRLYVDKSNKPAQAVYESLGMSAEHYELYEWLAD